jgi:hypothetical protein
VPNINDAFPSKYLKTSDLQGREPVVTIDRVEWEPVGRDRQMKAVLYFVGKEKAIVLNKTMATKVTELTGSAITEEWKGFKVKLYASEATFGGDTYDVVRIKAATTAAPKIRMTKQPEPPPPPPAEEDSDPDDDLDAALASPLTDEEIPF